MSTKDPADKIFKRNISDLTVLPSNARAHPPEQIRYIADRIEEVGFTSPILIDENNMIIAGHGRVEALKLLGRETVSVCIAAGWTETKKRKYAIEDNISFEGGGWDESAFMAEFEYLQNTDDALDVAGFDYLDFEFNTEEAPEEEADIPDIPETPISVMGDIWILGDHKVMCGDSTSVDQMLILMGDDRAEMTFTDPPWNVAYGTNLASNPMGYTDRTIKNDDFKTREGWKNFLSGFMKSISAATSDGSAMYCVMGASEWPEIDLALRNGGFHWSSTVIWAKDRLVLSRKDYHTQYEPIWYGWKEGHARLCPVKDRKQSDLWEVDRPHKSDLHPTTKPTELIVRALENSSKPGMIILDAFGGSGSTLIACEQTGRKSRLMELDEKYVDVIVRRWENYTGLKAINAKTGDEFPSIQEE